jgi:Tat protein translocase TatB subunit
MFGIGGQEMVIIALLFLIIFGPNALPKMARDLGRFVGEARRSIDEFKSELTAATDDEEDEKKRRR